MKNATPSERPRSNTQAIVLLGLPGAGKGTQAGRLSAALEIPHVSTGDLVRAAIREGATPAHLLQRYVSHGELVPDQVIRDLLLTRLSSADALGGFILDGYPRTELQALSLDRDLMHRNIRIGTVFHLDIAVAVVVRRLSGRRICEAAGHPYHVTDAPPRTPDRCDIDGTRLVQRADDVPELVERRIEAQRDSLARVVAYYREQGALCAVDAAQPASVLSDRMLDIANSSVRSRSDVAGTPESDDGHRQGLPDWIAPNRRWIVGETIEPNVKAGGD